MKNKAKEETQSKSFTEKIFEFFNLKRSLLLLFTVIYLIKNYIKSSVLSDPNAPASTLWHDKLPELPSQNPLYYETFDQSQILPNRAKTLFKIGVFFFLIFLTLRRLNAAAASGASPS